MRPPPLPEPFDTEDDAEARRLLSRYFGEGFTGADLDRWAGGGDRPEVANRFTADDVVALSFLSDCVPAAAVVEVLDRFSRLLAEIPSDMDLGDPFATTMSPACCAGRAGPCGSGRRCAASSATATFITAS